MRQIGVNQWTGEHPAIIESMLEVEHEIKKHTDYAQEKFNRLNPVDKLFSLLNKNLYRPFKTGQTEQEIYFPNKNTWMEISRIEKLDEVPDAHKFIIKLDILYVIDLYRGEGLGRQALNLLKNYATEAGCVVILYCRPFGVTNSDRPMAFTTMKEYISCWFDEGWEVIYEPECEAEVTKFFYSDSGLVNICLFDSGDKDIAPEDRLPVDRHFAFIPETVADEYREQLSERLNYKLSKWNR